MPAGYLLFHEYAPLSTVVYPFDGYKRGQDGTGKHICTSYCLFSHPNGGVLKGGLISMIEQLSEMLFANSSRSLGCKGSFTPSDYVTLMCKNR